MSVQLLDKTRKINKLLHNSSSSKVVFNDICQVLMETLSSNILVLSKKGKVLSWRSFYQGECQSPDTWLSECTRELSGNRKPYRYCR